MKQKYAEHLAKIGERKDSSRSKSRGRSPSDLSAPDRKEEHKGETKADQSFEGSQSNTTSMASIY
jgi:hypothetical protein